jgi:hypothetical protein
MNNELNVSSLFYKGQLFQIGDFIKTKVEYLDTINTMGFNHYHGGGVLTKIIVEPTTICNSLYLNHGFTYTSIGGLGYRFELDGNKTEYAFESSLVIIPDGLRAKDEYIKKYYLAPINKDKLDNLVAYLSIPEKELNKLGFYLRKNHKEIYDYICLTFKIRQGVYGKFADNNELSKLSMSILYKNGFTNNIKNHIYMFTSDNRPQNKSLCKSL